MARFLFVVPDFAGHIYPTIPVGAELARRGHETAWAGIPGVLNELLPAGQRFFPTAPDYAEELADTLNGRALGMGAAAAFKFLWFEVLLPMARAMIEGVGAAVEKFRPDVMVVDQQALAGAVVARKLGLRWATLATTSAELADPLAGWPLVDRAIRDARLALQLEAGLPRALAEDGDLLFSPYLVLAFTTEALVSSERAFPEHYELIGPSIAGRVETVEFPWSWLDARLPAVLVSLGTINHIEGERFFAVAVEALGSLPVQAVIVAPPGLVADTPANILVRPKVPQLALLGQMQAVVTHAGHNTVCESLAAGVPLVMAPIRDDQPIVADQVVRAGCGIRISFLRVRAPELRAAVQSALSDPGMRAEVDRVRRSFAAAPGPAGAAERLQRLAAQASLSAGRAGAEQ